MFGRDTHTRKAYQILRKAGRTFIHYLMKLQSCARVIENLRNVLEINLPENEYHVYRDCIV